MKLYKELQSAQREEVGEEWSVKQNPTFTQQTAVHVSPVNKSQH